jgi:hypothetical protein
VDVSPSGTDPPLAVAAQCNGDQGIGSFQNRARVVALYLRGVLDAVGRSYAFVPR